MRRIDFRSTGDGKCRRETAGNTWPAAFGFTANADGGIADVLRFAQAMDGVAARAGVGEVQQLRLQRLPFDAIGLLPGLAVRSQSQAFATVADGVPFLLCRRDRSIEFAGFFIGYGRDERGQLHQHLGFVVIESGASHLAADADSIVGTGEDSSQRIVIGGGDGIEFVVVAAGATHRKSKGGACQRIDLLRGIIHHESLFKPLVHVFGTEREEAGGSQEAVAFGGGCGGQKVAGDLLLEKAIVGNVAVDGVDHVVAVAPRVRVRDVPRGSGGFAVACDIEPMPPPAFAETRGCEQAVHEARVGGAGPVGEECLDLRGRRRQPGQIVGEAADEREARGVRDGGEMRWFDFRQDEAIHVIDWPCGLPYRGRLGIADRLECPVMCPDAFVRSGVGGGLCVDVFDWPGRAGFDPRGEVGDLGGGKRIAFLRHAAFGIFVADALHDQALFGIAGNDGGSRLSAAKNACVVIHAQTAGRLGIGRVTGVTVADKDRADFGLEELGLRVCGGAGEEKRCDYCSHDDFLRTRSAAQAGRCEPDCRRRGW